MPNYTVYHLHTEDSLLDSCTNHKLYADKAAELGQTAIGYSEHGNVYNWIEKKMYANSKGLKYLYECEVYLTASLDEKIRDNYHTILIAKNTEGRKELNILIDTSYKPDHFYYKPRISFDEFLNISDNIIKISACLASPLNNYPKSENADKKLFEKILLKYDYLEIQPHLCNEQRNYNFALYQASQKYNIPLIAGTDTHSINKYKAECRSILQRAKKIMYAAEDEFDLTYKSYDELVNMFKEQASLPLDVIREAIENTNVMANSVEDFVIDTSFKYPKLYDNEEEVFKNRINKMYNDKVKRGIIQKDPRYKEMVQEEMRVFKKIGMVGFMLFMSELVCWCWENNIPVGFCRGSVGGSMIAYLTDIIDVNPLVWGTMFSRFANEDRKEIGDIDLDISPSQRHLVYEHIIEEYGIDKTAYVLAMTTIADKGAIDDISRALADIYKEKQDWDLMNKYSLKNTKNIKALYEEDPERARAEYQELFYYFDGLVGTTIAQSMHPAGIIVSPVTLPDNYGTFWNDGKRILSINMEEIHEVSLVKYDILGLKNVEIIKDCCKLAGIPYPKSHTVNWNDNVVWNHITDSPAGIFQFESKYAFECLNKMGCHCVNDLSLVNASLRPSGESYRDRLLARETNHNPSEIIDKLLAGNHGFLVFQEDVIAFLQQICGLSGSQADNIRRAIGRKQMDRLQAALPQILEGYCSKSDKPRDIAEEEAKTFLQIIEDSSNYMFGYNHSTGYSMIGYMCGYLRYYYPCEFITAYLNNANNDDDISMGTALAKQLGITISGIMFGHSQSLYSCDPSKKIVYKGLSSIKFISDDVGLITSDVYNGSYDSFIDVLVALKSTKLNSKQLDILIKLNFFSEYGTPNNLLRAVEIFDELYEKKQLKIDKIQRLNLPLWIVQECCDHQTEKMFKGFDSVNLIKKIYYNSEDIKTSLSQQLVWENELLGYVQTVIPKINSTYYFIVEINNNWLTLYQLATGDTLKIKVRKNTLNSNPVSENQVIKVLEITQEKKWGKDENGNWIRKEEYEDILSKYSVLKS